MEIPKDLGSLKTAFEFGIAFLEKHFPESPRIDAEFLLLSLASMSRTDLILNPSKKLSPEIQDKFLNYLERRSRGEPVAYILGYKDFYKFRFTVSPAVLIPRPETEELVDYVLNQWIKIREIKIQKKVPTKKPLIVDLGSGSGCIGLSLLKSIPESTLICLDVSDEALQITQKNALNLGLVENKDFYLFHQPAEDLHQFKNKLQVILGRNEIDILVSNPPYIDFNDPLVELNVKGFEPHEALFAPEQGFKYLLDWSKIYSPLLSNPGFLMMEMGHLQSTLVLSHVKSLNLFENVSVIKDLSKIDRFIYAEKI
ncbi:MAG TPA: peptide chain release factor N(5)-glutamine methyltransferase [Pseudobdellovibrionaceae bacterium]|nr:peptide chain release factor N(5)-glutamine methyltransferase [Pseudobdellovibrionaceae bacterium]